MIRKIPSLGMPAIAAALLTVVGTVQIAAAQIAIENVNVIPMTDEIAHEGWTVFVEGDRIQDVGPAGEVDIPAGAQRIDGRGKYLIPGLAEMHGHVPSLDESEEYVHDVLFLYLANGITMVRGLLGSPGQLELREQANSGDILSPSLYLAGPAFSGGSIDSPAQAAERAEQYAEEGWDYLKVLPGLTRAEYDAMAETAQDAGIPFIGHVPSDVGLERAIDAGQQTIDHLDGYIDYLDGDEGALDSDRVDAAIEMTLEAGVWVVPTMALWETILGVRPVSEVSSFSELEYMPQDMVDDWISSHEDRRSDSEFDQNVVDLIAENRIRLLREMNESGVRILMGTDSPQQFSVPGFSLRRELPLMISAGMSPYEILVSGTRSVGEYLGDKADVGTIEEGRRADLVLLNANPFDNIMNVLDNDGVMVRGRWISGDEIEDRLEQIAGRD